MSNNEYLQNIINNNKKSSTYSYQEQSVFNNLSSNLENWFNSAMRNNGWYEINMRVQQSGSRAKGTAIKGKSDMDLFLSIYDPSNRKTLEDYFDMVYKYAKSLTNAYRRQNISIGLKYQGYDIDLVPAKRVNSENYQRNNDHYLWSSKRRVRTLTNIQKHIDTVINSGLQDMIILTKVWRDQNGLDFPSIYLELSVIEALKTDRKYSLESDFLTIFKYLVDVFPNKKIVDPGNCNNIISEDLTIAEKTQIHALAQKAIDAQYWSSVVK